MNHEIPHICPDCGREYDERMYFGHCPVCARYDEFCHSVYKEGCQICTVKND